VIVFADQDDAAGAIAGVEHDPIISRRRECRLLDQHVLAGVECGKRQFQVKPGRDRDHHRIDLRVGNRGAIIAVAGGAAVPPTELDRLLHVAAGIAPDNVPAQRPQVPAMDARDEAAPEKGDVHRMAHGNETMMP
jgi:hypothetical protein